MMSMQLTDSRTMLTEEHESYGSMWHRRSLLEKVLLVVNVVLFILCVASIIGLIVLNEEVNETESRIASTEAKLAALMGLTVVTSVETTGTSAETVATSAETVATSAETVATSAETVATSAETVVTSAETVVTSMEPSEQTAAMTTEATGEPLTIDSYCLTPACVSSAALLLEGMDEAVDPCEDFFKFTCGRWNKKNPVPPSKPRWTQFDVLRQELSYNIKSILERKEQETDSMPLKAARDMYAACTDLETVDGKKTKPLVNTLAKLCDGWPITEKVWEETKFNWIEVIAEVKRSFAGNLLLTPYVYLDDKNTSRCAIYIDQTSLGLSRPLMVGNESDITGAYSDYIIQAAKTIRSSITTQFANSDKEIINKAKDIFNFEVKLAKITVPMEERRDKERMYNPMTMSEITALTNNKIDWKLYLDTLFQDTEFNITEDDYIIVVEPKYLESLAQLIGDTKKETLANYILWRLVQALGPHTDKEMRDLDFQFTQVLSGTMAPESRWLVCANMANAYFGMALSTPYVQEEFEGSAKNQALEMIKNLRNSFKELVEEADWMDKKTKSLAEEKVEAIKEFIAYPDWILEKDNVTEYFEGVEITADDHFTNVINMKAWWVGKELKNLRLPTDKSRWITVPTTVNAFYSSNYNSISFPAGILQPPFFGQGRLRALDYGGIGTVIGHEITHGFDDQGRQSDKDGNSVQWWSNSTVDKYIEKAKCFIEQYSGYRLPELEDKLDTNVTLNGINTQGENIADNGGIRQAFRAYKKYVAENQPEKLLPGLEKYPPEKLFFLAFANVWCGQYTPSALMNQVLTGVHSPGQFRVLGSLSNTAYFSDVWDCVPGSKYNPKEKCVLW